MFKYVKKRIASWVIEEMNRDSYTGEATLINNSHISRGSSIAEIDTDINFDLSAAVGGRILRVRRFDHRKGMSDIQTYIITDADNIGERVAKIINLELIK